MVKTAQHFYEFGPFRVDALKRRLLRGGEVVPLTPKAFDTLLVLVERSGRVVEKDDLMERVWPGVAVEENNLTQNVSALRKALGERREEPQYIATVPGLGYRFIASVSESWPDDDRLSPGARAESDAAVVENEGAEQNGFAHAAGASTQEVAVEGVSASPIEPRATETHAVEPRAAGGGRSRKVLAAAALAAAVVLAGGYYLFATRARRAEATTNSNSQIKSIAILPFKQLGSEGADEYLGLGMADALITKLSGIRQIKVRPTSSIIKFADAGQDPSAAGRALDVDSVLDGRVQKSGDRIRVTVQLLRAADGSSLWGDTFDEKYTHIFAVEDRLSEQVVRAR